MQLAIAKMQVAATLVMQLFHTERRAVENRLVRYKQHWFGLVVHVPLATSAWYVPEECLPAKWDARIEHPQAKKEQDRDQDQFPTFAVCTLGRVSLPLDWGSR